MNSEGMIESCNVVQQLGELGKGNGEEIILSTLWAINLIKAHCPVVNELMVQRNKELELAKDHVVFELELEKERRIIVRVDEGLFEDPQEWENHFVDTYDQSGRLRIREKNHKLRMSVKIPLFHEIDPLMRHCLRIDIKPFSSETEQQLVEARELLRLETGTQEFRKHGKRIALKSGFEVWLNVSDEGEYWIEGDEGMPEDFEGNLPDGIAYVRDGVSKVEIHQSALMNKYREVFIANLSKTSRTAKGVLDVSVAEKKKAHIVENIDPSKIVEANERKLFEFLWERSDYHFDNPVNVLNFIDEIAGVVNSNLVETPKLWRTWDVKYGRQVKASDLGGEMMSFASEFMAKRAQLSKEHDFVEFASWVELQFDRHLHPYVDGCGRIAKALSCWVLMSRGLPLPDYINRDLYYGSMNEGDEIFQSYFRESYERGREEWKNTSIV